MAFPSFKGLRRTGRVTVRTFEQTKALTKAQQASAKKRRKGHAQLERDWLKIQLIDKIGKREQVYRPGMKPAVANPYSPGGRWHELPPYTIHPTVDRLEYRALEELRKEKYLERTWAKDLAVYQPTKKGLARYRAFKEKKLKKEKWMRTMEKERART